MEAHGSSLPPHAARRAAVSYPNLPYFVGPNL